MEKTSIPIGLNWTSFKKLRIELTSVQFLTELFQVLILYITMDIILSFARTISSLNFLQKTFEIFFGILRTTMWIEKFRQKSARIETESIQKRSRFDFSSLWKIDEFNKSYGKETRSLAPTNKLREFVHESVKEVRGCVFSNMLNILLFIMYPCPSINGRTLLS